MNTLLLRSVQDGSSTQDKYQTAFQEAGIGCVSLSPISFEFTNLDNLYAHISRPEDFSGLIFSSPRTVQSVAMALKQFSHDDEWDGSLKARWQKLPSFSVGTSTGSEVRRLGLEPVGEDSGNAENLCKVILDVIDPGSRPLLYPCGTMRRETIPKTLEKTGVQFTADVVYDTVSSPDLEEKFRKYLEEKGPPRYIVFFSPSGVQYAKKVLEVFQLHLQETKYLAIGATTRTAMEEHALEVAGMAGKPSPASLLDAIQKCNQGGVG